MELKPSDSTFGYTSEETQNTDSKEHMQPSVHCGKTCNSQDINATQVPINRPLDKEDVVPIRSEILLGHKKPLTFAIA